MQKANRLTLFSLLFVLLSTSVSGQLAVDYSPPYDDPNYLVNNILMGSGVVATGVTFIGDANQIAFFDGTLSNIGINQGVMMASGDCTEAIGPNNDCCITVGGGTGLSDPDLLAVSGVAINDAAVLEFDFVPAGDSVVFRYVFASDEYNEYACSNFNDAFGFFISGPGFAGPYTGGAENIALIPGSSTPVAINTVNLGVAGTSGTASTCAAANPNWTTDNIYFVNNDFPGTGTVEYDGFTVVLEALAAVQCGQTYHIKLAVGDAFDSAFDSGVFLEAESFTSTGVSVTATSLDGDSIVIEGCEPAIFAFARPDTTSDFTVHFDVAGTATSGVDYNSFPDSLTIPAGQFSDTIFVFAWEDAIIGEGTETIIVTVTYDGGCSGPDTVQAILVIENRDPLDIILNDDQNICVPEETGWLIANVTGGEPPLSYNWVLAEDTTVVISTADSVEVWPLETTEYVFYVIDDCGFFASAGPLEIEVQCDVIAPNVFSPNGDGINDFFYIINLDQYPNSNIEIYNRWGQLVYENGNYANDWDGTNGNSGKDVTEGVYYFIVTPNSNKQEPISGHVTVVR